MVRARATVEDEEKCVIAFAEWWRLRICLETWSKHVRLLDDICDMTDVFWLSMTKFWRIQYSSKWASNGRIRMIQTQTKVAGYYGDPAEVGYIRSELKTRV